MFIGNLEQRTGVSRETIRYYERREIITPPQRRDSGYREFEEQHVRELNFINRAKQLGFTLKEIKELLELRLDGSEPCGRVRNKARKKKEDIEKRIEDLQHMHDRLEKLISDCRAEKQNQKCVILESLAGNRASN